MWTDTGAAFDRIHSHLAKVGTAGYLGYLTLKGLPEHLHFVQAMARQLYLPTGIAIVDGSVVPQTSKYGVR